MPITMRHAARAPAVPLGHRDAFDELLLMQAQKEGLQVLTADRLLADHPLAIAVNGRVSGVFSKLVIRSHDASLRRQRSTKNAQA